MKLIAISQRVDEASTYNERRDALDQRWSMLLEASGFLPVPIPNCILNIESWMSQINPIGVILSGGNDIAHLEDGTNLASERDNTELRLIKFCRREGLPILGVCRGMQMLLVDADAKLERINNHSSGQVHKLLQLKNKKFPEIVKSYHKWGVQAHNLPSNLRPLATSEDNVLEAAYFNSDKEIGIMWHPEREDNNEKYHIKLLQDVFR